ncbi:2'-5' RNA ligase family protein [Streptosporangium sp. 'caverna']|uniref:2'-5' RNA ligase family protein n=1 Tax=Streptosporangium sp. 'caverna' TaxID=2202249 RepID=UPI000D7DF9DD|nr:2'-5' RNA ligase family protein [Streptosporangium sp. 'caverna']AWS41654.1 hypothetical protein DKM19_10120 [Streptosporangium sp. 'caverna']
MKIVIGPTALIVKVPEAEPVVGRWRERFDPFAARGVPAHVTVLYPFLDNGRIDDRLLGELRELFAAQASFEVRFDRCGRFPEVLYLAPEPEAWGEGESAPRWSHSWERRARSRGTATPMGSRITSVASSS